MSLHRRLKVLSLLFIKLDKGRIVPFNAIVFHARLELLLINRPDVSFKVFFPIKGRYKGTFLKAKIVAKFFCRFLIQLISIFGVKNLIEHICCIVQS